MEVQKEKAVKRSSSPPATTPIRSHPSWYKATSSSPSGEEGKQDWPDAKDMKIDGTGGGDVISGMGASSLDAPSSTSIPGGPIIASSEPLVSSNNNNNNNTIAPSKTPNPTTTTTVKGEGLAKGQSGGSAKKASSKETSVSNLTNRGGPSQASPSRLSEPKNVRQKVSTGVPVAAAAVGKEEKGAKEAKGANRVAAGSSPTKPSTAGGTQRGGGGGGGGGGGAKSEAKTTTATTTTAPSRGSKETPITTAPKPSTATSSGAITSTAGAKNDGGKGKQPDKKEENKKQSPPAVAVAAVAAATRIEAKIDGGGVEVKGTNDASGGDDGDDYGEEEFEASSRPGSAESKVPASSSVITDIVPVVIPPTATSQPPIEPDNKTVIATVPPIEADSKTVVEACVVVVPPSIIDNTKDALPTVTAAEQEPPPVSASSTTKTEAPTIAIDPAVPIATTPEEVASPSVVVEEVPPAVVVPTSSAAVVSEVVAVSGGEDDYGEESFEATSRPGSASGSPEKTTEATKETTAATATATTEVVTPTEATINDTKVNEDDDFMYLSDSDDNLGIVSAGKEGSTVMEPVKKETGVDEKKDDKPKADDDEHDYDLDF